MTRKRLQLITNLAQFIFADSKYKVFMRFIYAKEYTDARLYLDKFVIELEDLVDKLEFLDDDGALATQYKKADELVDQMIDLIIANDRRESERKQIGEVA